MNALPETPENPSSHPASSRSGNSRNRVIALLVIPAATVVLLGLLELAVRQLVPPETPLDRARTVITAEGLPALADLFDPDAELFWRLRPGLRGFRVSGTIEGYPLDFRVSTDELGRRITLTADGPDAPVLWALGDSATFGLGVEDDQAWPACLGRIASDRGKSLRVVNHGVPGYTAWQGARQLERLLRSQAPPDLLVAAFWANDKATWAGRGDPETARLLARSLSPAGWLDRLALARLPRWLEYIAHGGGQARPRLTEPEFTGCLRDILRLCRDHQIQAALLVWPSRPQVAERQRELHGYQKLVENTAVEAGCSLINPAGRFMAAAGDCFVDNFHGNAEGCRLAAEEVWAWVVEILNGKPAEMIRAE